VTRTTSATVPSGSHDLRPRPGATNPTPATPISENRFRQAITVSLVTPERRAFSRLETPSAAISNDRAWTTFRCGNEHDFAIDSNSERCSAVTTNGEATWIGIPGL
jgi:hypothetical protein